MVIENRTPHPVALIREDGTHLVLSPVAPAIRLEFEPGAREDECTDGVPIHGPMSTSGFTKPLPARRPGVLLLVSQIAAIGISAMHPERNDFVHPATTPRMRALRDKEGVRAVRALVRAT